jgi:hypothetical protein
MASHGRPGKKVQHIPDDEMVSQTQLYQRSTASMDEVMIWICNVMGERVSPSELMFLQSWNDH